MNHAVGEGLIIENHRDQRDDYDGVVAKKRATQSGSGNQPVAKLL